MLITDFELCGKTKKKGGGIYLLLHVPCIFTVPDDNNPVPLSGAARQMSVLFIITHSGPRCAWHPPGPPEPPVCDLGTRKWVWTQGSCHGLNCELPSFVSELPISQPPEDCGRWTCQLVSRRNSHIFTIPDDHGSDKDLIPRISRLYKGSPNLRGKEGIWKLGYSFAQTLQQGKRSDGK